MADPVIVQKAPFELEIKTGKYYWCSCGESANQPFCDGKHKEKQEFKPIVFEQKEDKKVWLCGCKKSTNVPFCDGTHKNI